MLTACAAHLCCAATDDNLLVKEVQFDGQIYPWHTEPSAVDSKWVYLDLFKQYGDFEDGVAYDVVIVVRGKVDSLCPANDFLHSSAACEFTMHGRDNMTQCCPHGATRRGPPPDDCCVDDIDKAPYRMEYLRTNSLPLSTSFDFAIRVVNVSGTDFDLEEKALCDSMTLDYAQIQICESARPGRGHMGREGDGWWHSGMKQPRMHCTACQPAG